MYESHFGLSRRPFSATPDPACFVGLPTVQEPFQQLFQCLKSGQGIGVLSGEAGTGKTLLCRKLAADLSGPFATLFLANTNYPTRRSLLQAILYELGRPYLCRDESELRLELITAVKAVCADKEAAVVIADEAHLLNEDLLEELRAVTNFTDDSRPLVRILLSGQLALEEKLADPQLAALNQRVACHATLEPLSQQESAEYITVRLKCAGSEPTDVFTPRAIRLICHASDGIPRCLNLLCDRSLQLGYVAGKRPISAEIVCDALEDLKQLPMQWNIPSSLDSFLELPGEPSAAEITGQSADECSTSLEREQSAASDRAERIYSKTGVPIVTNSLTAPPASPSPQTVAPDASEPTFAGRAGRVDDGWEPNSQNSALTSGPSSSIEVGAGDTVNSNLSPSEQETAHEVGAVVEVGADEAPGAASSQPAVVSEGPASGNGDAPAEKKPDDEGVPVPFGVPDGDGWRQSDEPDAGSDSDGDVPVASGRSLQSEPQPRARQQQADQETNVSSKNGPEHALLNATVGQTAAQFEEETVVDPYARLDAGESWTWTDGPQTVPVSLGVPQRSSSEPSPADPPPEGETQWREGRFGVPERSAVPVGHVPASGRASQPMGRPDQSRETQSSVVRETADPARGVAWLENQATTQGVPRKQARPDETVAQMNPWLKRALETDRPAMGGHSPAATAADLDAQSQLVGWPLERPEQSLEERIRSDVFDVCAETRENLEESMRNQGLGAGEETLLMPPFQTDAGPSADRSAFNFDVVQPEPQGMASRTAARADRHATDHRTDQDGPATGSPPRAETRTVRQYKYLFNELRTRKRHS